MNKVHISPHLHPTPRTASHFVSASCACIPRSVHIMRGDRTSVWASLGQRARRRARSSAVGAPRADRQTRPASRSIRTHNWCRDATRREDQHGFDGRTIERTSRPPRSRPPAVVMCARQGFSGGGAGKPFTRCRDARIALESIGNNYAGRIGLRGLAGI